MVDLNQASNVLQRAYNKAILLNSDEALEVDGRVYKILLGEHLTFRYILITNLLAKATNPKIHARALQAGSKLKGAFDSRSVCHKVLVPFERSKLNSILGGSNEPYLNKPARFEEVSKKNPVRAGNDQTLLIDLYDILEFVNTGSYKAFSLLVKSLAILKKESDKKFQQIEAIQSPVKKDILGKIENFLKQSCEGQSAALVADILFELIYQKIQPTLDVSSHPVNQSGKSSNEVLDIDIKETNKVICSLEVKDKKVLITDINHMFKKAKDKGVLNLGIILGPKGELEMPLSDFPVIQLTSLLGVTALIYGDIFGDVFIESLKRRMISKRIGDKCRLNIHKCFK
jgi:hypothetical protein